MDKKEEKLKKLLEEVLDYRFGRQKYNFTGLNDYDRQNASFDAWMSLEDKIKKELYG